MGDPKLQSKPGFMIKVEGILIQAIAPGGKVGHTLVKADGNEIVTQMRVSGKSTIEAAISVVGAIHSIISGQSTPIASSVKSKGVTWKTIEEVWKKVVQ